MAISAIAASPTAQFVSGVSLVEVYATVIDASGQPVDGLTRDDFIVEEDGVRQSIDAFTAGNFPLSLAIAVDRSFSMSQTRLTQAVFAVQRLLGELRADDKVTVLAIGSDVETPSPLSVDHRAAYDAIAGLQPWGTTPLFDATVSAIGAIQNASGRRALILITDGADRYSASTAADMVAFARRHDVLVYPVALRRPAPPVLAELASVTGARSMAVTDAQLSPTLTSIANELRHQYLLGYAPRQPADGVHDAWRAIRVSVARDGVRVRARDGYYAMR
ncbi:MAG: VWA domain-containing protein [Vicinamibacterales bacterium]